MSAVAVRAVQWGVGVVAAVLIIIIPLNSSPYVNHQLALVAVYAVAMLGLNILTGHAGQISLAQAAFFGTGAYTAAIAANAGMPVPVSFVLACLVPALAGLIIALPAVRLHGHALAMITLAVSLVSVPLARRLESLTGGSRGLRADLGHAPAWSGLDDDQWGLYVIAAVTAVLFLIARNMVKGKMGRALALLRTNEVVATSMGVPVRRYKVLAFSIAAGYGGAAGFLFAYSTRYVSPDTLGFLLGITMLAALVIGGLRSLLGPIIGALFYIYVPTIAGSVSPEQSSLMYGVVLVLVVLFVPGGVAGVFRALPRLFRRRDRTPGTSAHPGSTDIRPADDRSTSPTDRAAPDKSIDPTEGTYQ